MHKGLYFASARRLFGHGMEGEEQRRKAVKILVESGVYEYLIKKDCSHIGCSELLNSLTEFRNDIKKEIENKIDYELVSIYERLQGVSCGKECASIPSDRKSKNFININSAYGLTYDLENSIIGRMSNLLDKFWSIPIYLLDEELMDILYPPKKRRTLRKECVRELLEGWEDEREESDQNIFGRLERCLEVDHSAMIAVGVYYPSLSASQTGIMGQNNIDHKGDEAIFICHERIWKCADKCSQSTGVELNFAYKIITEMVIIHEIAHGFMYSRAKSNYHN